MNGLAAKGREGSLTQIEDCIMNRGSDYRVEVVIPSLYWTDASVGRVPQQRGWW